MADYKSKHTASEIETILDTAILSSEQRLTEEQKAQARKNIGAGNSDTGLVISGFFSTITELRSTAINPKAGQAYAVGTAAPYNIWVWDAIGQDWVNCGNIRGADGVSPQITKANVLSAIGYTPVNEVQAKLKPGTSVTVSGIFACGIVTSTSQTIQLFVPLPMLTNDISTAKATSLVGGVRVPSGGYISDGSTASDTSNWIDGSNVSSVACNVMSNGVKVTITGLTAFKVGSASVTNNIPVVMRMTATFTFS